jgi:hypothetical protein
MSLEAVLRGTQLDVLIGAVAGLVPLIVGYLCRERRQAITGFLGCMLGGAIGGINVAIAIAAATTTQIVKPVQQVGERANQWSGLATVADKLCYVTAICWLFICTVGTALVSAAFFTPLVLGVPNYVPRDSVGKIMEPLMLFGGFGLGITFGLVGVSFICRRFISSATHSNWAKELESSPLNRSWLLQRIVRYYYGFLLPRDWPFPKQQ